MNSVRLRLILWNLLVFALAFTVLGLILREQVRTNLARRVDRELTNRARPFLKMPAAFSEMPESARREMEENWRKAEREWKRLGNSPFPPAERYLQPSFYDKTGHNIITRDSAPNLDEIQKVVGNGQTRFTTATVALTPESSPEPVRVFTAPLRNIRGQVDSVVQLVEPLNPVNQEVAHLTRILITLIPLALLLAGIGAAFLTERALKPVRDVTNAAAEIQITDLSRRLTIAGKDEFARLADTFNGMLSRLETSFSQQKRFVADASHELRTPLTVIKANTTLALSEPDLPTETKEVLTDIDQAADRTIRIVQDLLLLARSDSGELPLNFERVDVVALLEQVALEGRKLYPQGPAIHIPPASSLALQGDRHYLFRLLWNLTENALRHTPPDGTVSLHASAKDDTLLIEVMDTGVGITAEHLPHIGERFYRVDASRTRAGGGTGLGIAISRTIAEAHGGSLHIESVPGCGTTVRVVLRKG